MQFSAAIPPDANLERVALPFKIGPFSFALKFSIITGISGIESVGTFTIPDNSKYIGSFAFANTDIKEITIPKSVQHINNNAFSECDDLEIVNIQTGLKTLHSGVFSSCYKLKQINFPTTLTDVGRNCFLGCYALPEEIYLTEGLTTIHEGAFDIGSNNTHTYFLPKSLKYIHPEAFGYMSKLVVHENSYAHRYALGMTDRYEVEVIP